MIKLALKLIIFLLPLAVLIGIAEYKARFIQSDYGRKVMIAEQNIEKAEIIFLGASHTYYGIKAQMFDVPSLNLAFISQDLYYDNRILSKYLPRAKNLKLAIISVSYPSLEGETESSIESWRCSFYNHFWGIPRRSQKFILSDYSALALFGVETSRNYLLKNHLPQLEEIDNSGSPIGLRPVNPTLMQKADKNIERHQKNMKKEMIAYNLEYLTDMIEKLQTANVKVIIITPPCFHNYYEKMNSNDYAVMQDNVKSLSEKYNVEYYNYLKDSRFNENDFTDSDHLNTQGSEKLTLIVKDAIRNPESKTLSLF